MTTSSGGSPPARNSHSQSDQPRGPHGSALPVDDALRLLTDGRLEIEGQLVDASNVTLYCTVSDAEWSADCVYKPIRGERPLWDFPAGTLAEREVAAYEVSAATGWQVVPPTVLREGPFGAGMVQLWIDADEGVDLLQLARSDNPSLRRMAVLDVVVNNTDRKGGHLLPMPDGHVYGVDHGVCFNVDDKLRTLLWQWAGERLTDEAIAVLESLRLELHDDLGDRLEDLLTRREVVTTRKRVERMLSARRHPEPSGEWPAVPWPPI